MLSILVPFIQKLYESIARNGKPSGSGSNIRIHSGCIANVVTQYDTDNRNQGYNSWQNKGYVFHLNVLLTD